jgi:hypothetical protein
MANHKRKGPKSTRAGCLLCKPYKRQGTAMAQRQTFGETRKLRVAAEKIAETTSVLAGSRV